MDVLEPESLEERMIVMDIHFDTSIRQYVAETFMHGRVITVDPDEYEPLNESYDGMPVYVMKKDVHEEYIKMYLEAQELYGGNNNE